MSQPLSINVQESLTELKALYKKTKPFLHPRLNLLIALKKHNNNPVSKRALMEQTGLCSYSVHKWRTLYLRNGIAGILSHNKKGYKPTILNDEQHNKLKSKLSDAQNGIRGYKELVQWVKEDLEVNISYITLYKYCTSKFGSKIKVARKYHAKKVVEEVETFKKTSVQSVKKQLKK